MKILLQKILSQKKYVTLIIILFLCMVASAGYVIKGVQTNLELMQESVEDAGEVEYFPDYPKVDTQGKNAALIQRGEYLTKAGDCIACHTNTTEKGPTFAGGLAMRTPFGTIYSPNITPDKETGIGKWTDEQFIKAMRQGISPQGHYYYPAFPYFYFNKVTTDDLRAIKAYLDAVPAVHQVNRPNEMIKPFNERFLQLGWRMLFFKGQPAGTEITNPKKSPEWNRGAYLVEGLGHCAMCHSPSYHVITESIPLGAPIQKYDLTGAKIQGFLAPNITKVNLDTTSVDEVVRVFTEDRLIGGGKVEGPMLEVNHDSLRYLSPADLKAISVYLKSVKSAMPPKPSASGVPGKGVYEAYCAGCHTTGAGGAPQYGDASSWQTVLKHGKETVYTNAIHGIGGMPAKGTCLSCSDDEIKQAVDYMINAATSGAGRPNMTKQKPLTMADGKRIYDSNCSVCHNGGFNGAPKLGDFKAWAPSIKAGFLETYKNVMTGESGHPPHGACATCTDADVIAAVKYMMQKGNTTNNYNLW